jgi:HrpA-like RNA helicase
MLPVQAQLPQILDMIDENRVSGYESSTGSGKTTMIPPGYVLKHGKTKRVMVIQPIVISCQRSKDRVQKLYPDLVVEICAGGRNRMNDQTDVAFVTAGHAIIDFGIHHDFPGIDLVIFDECHVQCVEYEMLGKMIRHFFHSLKFHVLLLSATLHSEVLSSWERLIQKPLPILTLKFQIFPVEETFHNRDYSFGKDEQQVLLHDACTYLVQENKNAEPGHFLVFCSGLEQINKLEKLLYSEKSLGNCSIYTAHSTVPEDELDRALSQVLPLDGSRSFILTTDLCETSVTVPHVVRVLELGQQKICICPNDVSILKTVQVSRVATIQRKGRTGRTNPGKIHRMYTKETYDNLEPNYPPALERHPLHQMVLNLVSFNIPVYDLLPEFKSKLDVCLQSLQADGLLFYNRRNELKMSMEAKAICYWPLSLPLSRVLYKVYQLPTPQEQLVGMLSVVIAEVEKTSILCFYPRKKREESNDEYEHRLDDQKQKWSRFAESSCCPLNSSVFAYFLYLKESTFKTRIQWVQEHGLNNKTIKMIGLLLKRIRPIYLKDDLNAELISNIFQDKIIPLFQLRFHQIFIPGWFDVKLPEHDRNANTSYRLNNKSFDFEKPPSDKVLCLYANHAQKGTFELKIISIYVFLKDEKDYLVFTN